MTSFVDSRHSFEHSGLVRVQCAALFLQETMAELIGSQRLSLRMLGSLVRRAAVTVRAGHRDWVQSRKQAVEDELIWNAALKDARIMADLSRAMQGQAR